MRLLTITMTTPWAHHVTTATLFGRSDAGMARRVARSIRNYAQKHSLPISAVDYETTWSTAS